MIRLSPFKSVEPFRVSVVRSLFSGAEETTAVLKRILWYSAEAQLNRKRSIWIVTSAPYVRLVGHIPRLSAKAIKQNIFY